MIAQAFEEVNDTITKQPYLNADYGTKKTMLKEWAKRSPYIMGKFILGYDRFCDTQLEWDEIVRKNIDLTGNTAYKGMFLFPRETFKTTFWTITLDITFLVNNPDLTILIASEIGDNSKDMLKEMKSHFEGNDKFIELFGSWFNRNDWNKESITIRPKKNKGKEASVQAIGIGGKITSKHFNIINCDDIAGTKDRDSKPGRLQTFLFFQDIWDILKKDAGVFLMPGTRWHVRDVYHHVKEVLNPRLKRDGLAPFDIHEKPAAGGKNYPILLPKKKLDELRTVKIGEDGMDVSTYEAQYELNPLDPKTQVFRNFHYYNHNNTKYKTMIQFTDPALKDNSGACYSAIVVIGKISDGDNKGRWGVLWASIKRRKPSEIIKDHNNIYVMLREKYKCDYDIFMESNGFQNLLKDDTIRSALESGEEIPTIGVPNTENKPARIRSLEPYVSQGLLLFREDFQTAPDGYYLLLEQLRNFPQGEKDGPDALQSAFKKSQSRFYN